MRIEAWLTSSGTFRLNLLRLIGWTWIKLEIIGWWYLLALTLCDGNFAFVINWWRGLWQIDISIIDIYLILAGTGRTFKSLTDVFKICVKIISEFLNWSLFIEVNRNQRLEALQINIPASDLIFKPFINLFLPEDDEHWVLLTSS